MQQFNPIDAALLFLESAHTPFHVSNVSIYDPSTCPGDPPGFEDILAAVENSLPVVKPFRRKILHVPMNFDYPYWIEDEHFNLEFHMRQLALPHPGNWEQFRNQVSRLISRPLDLSRPPWEMTVIEGLDSLDGLPPGCFATVLKIHHCAIDGKSGVALINAIHQDSPRKKLKKLKDDWQPEAIPPNRLLLRRAAFNAVKRPLAITRKLAANARALVSSAYTELRSEHDHDHELLAPPTILNAPISSHRVVDYVLCPLDDIKMARRSVEGATVNDVCLAIVAGAMRRYLEAKQALPDESLVTVVPISTRTPEEADAGGNQIAITRVSMYTDVEDPIERLSAISSDTRKMKAMQEGVVMDVMLDVVHNLPGSLVGAAARVVPLMVTRSNTFCNTMVSNVPGPTRPIYFLGAKAVHMFGSPPLMDGGAILHGVGSYNGEFIFTFTACRDLLADPDIYCDCLRSSIDDMIDAVRKE